MLYPFAHDNIGAPVGITNLLKSKRSGIILPMMTHQQLREKFEKFLEKRGHKKIPAAPLVLTGDATTLFTSSGMQPLVPYLLGETHPEGTKLFDIQPCIRTQDIEEVGDNRHDTFFEMLGNWSLGEYFKKEQLGWYWEFLTIELELPKERLYITIFKGTDEIPKDEESLNIWKNLGVKEDHIYEYSYDKNWWSRSGTPDKMPVGEIGGPDSEVFYDFGEELKLHEKSQWKNEKCHPNCDCGRFLEIGNSVFIQYIKNKEGKLVELPKKNVDFGGGIERTAAALNQDPDIFTADLFSSIIKTVETVTGKNYQEESNKPAMRIIADHMRASTFLIKNGVTPSNKEHGYILRRLLRRAAIKLQSLKGSFNTTDFSQIAKAVMLTFKDIYFDTEKDEPQISNVINQEMQKFSKTLERGLKEISKIQTIDAKKAFDLYQSYGFPLEITEEIFREKGQHINREEFYKEFEHHKNLSRSASAGMFKGGLADQSEKTLKYHTATHLLHQALFDVLGNDVRQEGSNITGERLRFDFSSSRKPEKAELDKVQEIINQKIAEELPMRFKIMPKAEAEKVGAKSFFKEKYPDSVKIYYIGGDDDKPETAYSKEFCGGPHVTNTKEIGKLEIYKFEKIGSTMYRVYAR